MLQLNEKLLTEGAVGALLVIAGVVIGNSLDQLGLRNRFLKGTAAVLFVAGWVSVAISIATGRSPAAAAGTWIAAGAIVLAVVIMKSTKGQTSALRNNALPVVFALAWLTLGIIASSDALNTGARLWGVLAACMVVASMLISLPKQRLGCVVDGPGMPLFVGAWAVLVVSNAAR